MIFRPVKPFILTPVIRLHNRGDEGGEGGTVTYAEEKTDSCFYFLSSPLSLRDFPPLPHSPCTCHSCYSVLSLRQGGFDHISTVWIFSIFFPMSSTRNCYQGCWYPPTRIDLKSAHAIRPRLQNLVILRFLTAGDVFAQFVFFVKLYFSDFNLYWKQGSWGRKFTMRVMNYENSPCC